jgi:NAD(P)-dependent dehydrogenase (short-subunit alcohol dehydrogenase family)
MEKTIVVTGATGGLGQAAAIGFAPHHRVIVVGRDAVRGAETVAAVRAAGGTADLVLGDVSTRAGVAAVAAAIRGMTSRIDVLVNNAGGNFDADKKTEDGIERTFALNTLGPWLLEQALHAELAAAKGRVVNVATGFLDWYPLEVDDLVAPKKFATTAQYAKCKLASVMMTIEQSARFAPEGITVVSMHPGIIMGTQFGGGQPKIAQAIGGPIMRLFGVACTMDEAVAKFRVSAFDPVPTGSYLVNGKPAPLPKQAQDAAIRAGVIGLLEKLVA